MSNRLRLRSGEVELVKVRVDAATVIEAGDLVYLDTDDAKPASVFPWTTDLATTQAGFADVFLGVAHQQSAEGDTEDISVDISPHAVYEMDVNSAAYEVGAKLGPDENSSHLMSQQLEAVASDTRAIARAAEHKPSGSTTLRVRLASAFAAGSANRNAAVG